MYILIYWSERTIANSDETTFVLRSKLGRL